MSQRQEGLIDQVFDTQLCRLVMDLDQLYNCPSLDKISVLAKLNRYEDNQRRVIQGFRDKLLGLVSVNTTNLMLTDHARAGPITNYPSGTPHVIMSESILGERPGYLDIASDGANLLSNCQMSDAHYAFGPDFFLGHELSDITTGDVDVTGLCEPLSGSAAEQVIITGTPQAWPSVLRTLQPASHQQPSGRTTPTITPAKRKSVMTHKQNVQEKGQSKRKQLNNIDNNLYQNVFEQLCEFDKMQTETVCRFYLAIGSPDSLTQLQAVIDSIGNRKERSIHYKASTIADIMSSLERIEQSEQINGFQRRILLLRLYEFFRDTKARLVAEKSESSENSVNACRQTQRYGKPSSIARDELMTSAFPKIDPPLEAEDRSKWRRKHEVQRKILENRLGAAKHWYLAVARFGIGIIALIPTGGEFQIQNQSYETLHESSCEVLFVMLAAKDAGFVTRAAQKLTPFVQNIYEGLPFPATSDVQDLHRVYTQLMTSAGAKGLPQGTPSA